MPFEELCAQVPDGRVSWSLRGDAEVTRFASIADLVKQLPLAVHGYFGSEERFEIGIGRFVGEIKGRLQGCERCGRSWLVVIEGMSLESQVLEERAERCVCPRTR